MIKRDAVSDLSGVSPAGEERVASSTRLTQIKVSTDFKFHSFV